MTPTPLQIAESKALELMADVRKLYDDQNKEQHSCVVQICYEDGTNLIYHGAIASKWKDWNFVYTEHHGIVVCHETDAVVKQFVRVWDIPEVKIE